MSSRVIGIDIGSTSVRAVELKGDQIVKAAEVPLAEGSVRRGEVLDVASVTNSIRRLWSVGRFGSRDVVLGMGGPRVLVRDLAMPRMPLPQVKEALPFHVQELLPVPASEAILDFYPISDGATESGPVVNGLLVAAVKEAVESNVKAVTKAGLTPVQVDLIPFALSRYLAAPGGAAGLTALVSIGANTTNVVILEDGVPQFVRIIAAGGDDITRALSSRTDLTPVQADAAKREIGLGSSTTREAHRPIVEVIYHVGGEQLNGLRNTLNFFVNTRPASGISQIVLSGGGSYLPGLEHTLSDLTGIPVVRVRQPARPDGVPFTDNPDTFATAYALALGSRA